MSLCAGVWRVALCVVLAGMGVCRADDAFDLRPVPEFLKLPEGWKLGPCSAVAVNRRGEILLLHRGEHPVLVFDAQGTYLRSWGDDLLKTPHGLRVDGEDHVWATDIGGHRVFRFDATGKLLLSLGNGQPGTGDDQFNKPTDVGFGDDGHVFVTDGYGNARVQKFSATGKLVHSWGKPGTGPGEFQLPHAVVVDGRGRVLVGDRENNRIQIFDQSGGLLEVWSGFAPYGLAFDGDGRLFVADARAHRVWQLDAKGQVRRGWGSPGKGLAEFDLPHMLGFDGTGNLFVAEVGNQRMRKFVREQTSPE